MISRFIVNANTLWRSSSWSSLLFYQRLCSGAEGKSESDSGSTLNDKQRQEHSSSVEYSSIANEKQQTTSPNASLNVSDKFEFNEDELQESFIKGSGPGGQAVNKRSNSVQLKHLPTGIVVTCHQTRSLFENRRLARKLLYEKLEYLLRGEDSIVGRRMQRSTKKSVENRRRQKLREKAKSQALEIADEIHTDDRDT